MIINIFAAYVILVWVGFYLTEKIRGKETSFTLSLQSAWPWIGYPTLLVLPACAYVGYINEEPVVLWTALALFALYLISFAIRKAVKI